MMTTNSVGVHEVWAIVRKHPEGIKTAAIAKELKTTESNVRTRLSKLRLQGYVVMLWSDTAAPSPKMADGGDSLTPLRIGAKPKDKRRAKK